MKKAIVSLSLVLGFGYAGHSQENGTQTSKMKIYRVETTTPEQKADLSKEEEIANCKMLLEALDAKEAWIRSNPEELKIAEESGWFVEAAATRAKLQARLKELGAN